MGTLDDTITLSGQTFPIIGPGQSDSVSEFEGGVKIGPANYDTREHAFFQVLNDFSGGLGHRHMNVREEQGTFWDTDAQAMDTRRPQHLILPPNRVSVNPNTDPTSLIGDASNPSLRADDGTWLVGIGNGIYQSNAGLTSWTLREDVTNSPAQVQRIVRTRAAAPDAAPASVYLAAIVGSPYETSEDGSTWSAGSKTLHDAIWWDNKIVAIEYDATDDNHRIIFGIISAGVEAWNIDDVEDGQPIWEIQPRPAFRNPFILGIAQSPTLNEQVIYFTDGWDIFWLDFFARRAHKIDTSLPGTPILGGTVWEGNVIWTDGWEVWSYGPSNGTLREIGLPRRFGIPDGLQRHFLSCLIPAGQFLYAILFDSEIVSDNTFSALLLCYNGIGWHVLGAEFTGIAPWGFIASPNSVYLETRFLCVPYNPDNVDFDFEVYQYNIPLTGQTPVVGVDEFLSLGRWITGWLDGGFNDIYGTLLSLSIDAFNLTGNETVTAYFQLDNDESGDWVQLCDANGDAAAFDNTNTKLYFNASNPGRGRKFRTVRFQFRVARGATATLTPEIRALTWVYLKTPPLRTSVTLNIDINRMLEEPSVYTVDAADATMENIWEKLKTLWINDHRLLRLVIPGIAPDGLNVKIQAMPISFEDFRTTVAGRGALTLTLIEVIESIAEASGTEVTL